TRRIEPHSEKGPVVARTFELHASGRYSILALSKEVYRLTGYRIYKATLHKMLRNPIYYGPFIWRGQTYQGTHDALISAEVFMKVQTILAGRSRPCYSKHDLAFRGLVNCAYDGCMVTGELAKGKYVYYRCTGHRGKCALPRSREQELAERLGELLRDIQVPEEVAKRIGESMAAVQAQASEGAAREHTRLDRELKALITRMDGAYADKLDGKI